MFDIITSKLHKIPEFSQLTDIDIKILLNDVDCNVVDYEVNQTIIREDDINNNIYIVIEGKLANFTNKWLTDNHVELTVDELAPGDVFGEINLNKTLGQGHVGTIRTFGKTTLFKINRWLLSNYLTQWKEINTHMFLKEGNLERLAML